MNRAIPYRAAGLRCRPNPGHGSSGAFPHPLFKTVVLAGAISWMALSPERTDAFVTVLVSPPSVNVPLTSSTSVAMAWTINAGTNVGQPITVSSASASFTATCAGTSLRTVNTSLSDTKPGPSATFAFSEVVQVPVDLVLQANRLGLGQINYERIWGDAGTQVPQVARICVPINITGSSAAGFNVLRLALSFDNGAPVRVLAVKDALHATAEVSFTGSGMLQGTWEIAEPASTSGQPVFRTLSLVRRYLVGGNRETLRSPALPTDSSGLYLLRLRVTDPASTLDTPVIRYFVGTGRPGVPAPVIPLGLLAPPDRAMLVPDTLFAWEPLRGARAYQLEIYAAPRVSGDVLPQLGEDISAPAPALPSTRPAAGMLLAGTRTRTGLSAAARSHLIPGRFYLWRVLAVAGDGAIVGQSPLRELRMPD